MRVRKGFIIINILSLRNEKRSLFNNNSTTLCICSLLYIFNYCCHICFAKLSARVIIIFFPMLFLQNKFMIRWAKYACANYWIWIYDSRNLKVLKYSQLKYEILPTKTINYIYIIYFLLIIILCSVLDFCSKSHISVIYAWQ